MEPERDGAQAGAWPDSLAAESEDVRIGGEPGGGAVDERASDGGAGQAQPTTVKRPKSAVREYAEAILTAVILTLFLRAFIVQAFRIPTGSMEDTLEVGDFLFVNKFLYGVRIPLTSWRLPAVREPRPGDVIVFKYPRDPSKDFIKRCVAIGGQTVEIRNRQVYVDGVRQQEPFVKFSDLATLGGRGDPRDSFGPETVPPGYLFMLGDNRDNSSDSRYWGYLDRDLVEGKALFIYWSWDPARKLLGLFPTPRLERIGDPIR
jgi:signal peptidase I